MSARRLLGLAPMARTAFAGGDLGRLGTRLLARLRRDERDANALLDLSTALQLKGERDLGLSMQAVALQIRQLYRIDSAVQPSRVRLLAIVSPGDLAQNNTLELLTEQSDIQLNLLYVAPGLAGPLTLPDFDVAMVAVCESDRNRPLLQHIETIVKSWPQPVLCRPQAISRLGRDGVCSLIHSRPGLVVPVTRRIDRSALAAASDTQYPLIARPVDSQKGFGLSRLNHVGDSFSYLGQRPEEEFYVAPYVDYRSSDGQFRKYRIVLIAGRPYACHMAIWSDWMLHYKNTGMSESPAKRAEEAEFFATFDNGFAQRHKAALRYLAQQLELEYVGIDCGETREGELLIFEVDSGMTVHAMDAVDDFSYKQPQMTKVFRAFRNMLIDAAGPRDRYSGMFS